MGFPQSKASKATVARQDIWRLSGPLESSGDIYEGDVSATAIAIGPNSDISRMQAVYFDEQAENSTAIGSFSVSRPWTGRIDARNSGQYPSKDKALILLSTQDLVPQSNYRPPSAGVDDVIELMRPCLDVFFYLSALGDVNAERSDKAHLYEQLPDFANANPQWFLVPFYGRRFTEVTLKNLAFVGALDVTAELYGLNMSNVLADPSLTDNGNQEILLDSKVISAGTSETMAVQSRAFDYLGVKLVHGAGAAFVDVNQVVTHITVSDKV